MTFDFGINLALIAVACWGIVAKWDLDRAAFWLGLLFLVRATWPYLARAY